MTVNKKIFRFQIPVYEVQVVKIFEGQNDLGCIKSRVWFAK
jgi:hypothetical protein